LPRIKHADGLAGIKAEFMLENTRCILPNPTFDASTEKRTSDLLDLLIYLIHLCPYRENSVASSSRTKPLLRLFIAGHDQSV
jgi:hypothetical protein